MNCHTKLHTSGILKQSTSTANTAKEGVMLHLYFSKVQFQISSMISKYCIHTKWTYYKLFKMLFNWFLLFNDAVSTAEVMKCQLRQRHDHEWLVCKDLEGSRNDTTLIFAWKEWEKPNQTSFSIASILAKIWNRSYL